MIFFTFLTRFKHESERIAGTLSFLLSINRTSCVITFHNSLWFFPCNEHFNITITNFNVYYLCNQNNKQNIIITLIHYLIKMNFISCNTILIKTLLSTIVLDMSSSFTIKQSGGKHSNPHSLNHNQNYNRKSFVENYYLPSSIEAEGKEK